jgi:uncharacterized protein YecT (DUF1311 family)
MESMKTPLLILIALFAVNVPIRAQHMNAKDSPCANIVVTVDLTNCLAKARDAVDAELNAAYQHLQAKLDGADGRRLVSAPLVSVS